MGTGKRTDIADILNVGAQKWLRGNKKKSYYSLMNPMTGKFLSAGNKCSTGDNFCISKAETGKKQGSKAPSGAVLGNTECYLWNDKSWSGTIPCPQDAKDEETAFCDKTNRVVPSSCGKKESLCLPCETKDCILPPGIPISYLGDGFCDDEINTAECGFDKGDCCNNERTNAFAYCTKCECKSTDSSSFEIQEYLVRGIGKRANKDSQRWKRVWIKEDCTEESVTANECKED